VHGAVCLHGDKERLCLRETGPQINTHMLLDLVGVDEEEEEEKLMIE
jgi:hypothetical protein